MFERRIPDENRLNGRQKIVVILMDLFLLVELTFSIYLAKQNPEYISGVFLRTFVPLMVTTVVLARVFMRRLRTDEEECVNPLETKL